VYHAPTTQFVASFIGSTNLLTGEVTRGGGPDTAVEVRTDLGTLLCETASERRAGDRVAIAIRPEDIVVHRQHTSTHDALDRPNVFAGKVLLGLFTGTNVDYELDVGGVTIHGRSGSRHPMDDGEDVQVELPPQACRLFAVDDDRSAGGMADLVEAPVEVAPTILTSDA
jgi:iron(III) transport system ATP-binding protein